MPTAPKTFRLHGLPARKRDFRQSAAKRGYDARWNRVRDAARRRDKHLCQDCLAEGILNDQQIEVDHIIPVHIRPDLRLVLSNCICRCKRHHRLKTLADEKKCGALIASKLNCGTNHG